MPCLSPLHGYWAKEKNDSGKYSIVFNPMHSSQPDKVIKLPCSQCRGCRADRTKGWALRIMHQASLSDSSTFVTLTYDEKNIPVDRNVNINDPRNFLKRLKETVRREQIKRAKKLGIKRQKIEIKYYGCAEYGEHYQRPHYHICIMNWDWPDKYPWSKNERGETYYRSPMLEKLWTDGMSMAGDLTEESAAYVARYICKKITGKKGPSHYTFEDPDGNEVKITPEFAFMSKGLGLEWYKKYKKDLYPGDFALLKGKKIKIPKYYDTKYEAEHPDEMEPIKERRLKNATKHNENNTWQRLRTRRELAEITATKTQKRKLEK